MNLQTNFVSDSLLKITSVKKEQMTDGRSHSKDIQNRSLVQKGLKWEFDTLISGNKTKMGLTQTVR